jgi:hypothetical protein
MIRVPEEFFVRHITNIHEGGGDKMPVTPIQHGIYMSKISSCVKNGAARSIALQTEVQQVLLVFDNPLVHKTVPHIDVARYRLAENLTHLIFNSLIY